MTILADFNENGDFLGFKPKMLTPDDVNLYIAQYSHQRCLGYIDCLDDITKFLDENGNSLYPNSDENLDENPLRNYHRMLDDIWLAFEQKIGEGKMFSSPKSPNLK